MTTEKQENRTFHNEIFLVHSNTVTGFLTLTFFITRVTISYTGPWLLLFAVIGLVNIMLKFWMIIRSYHSEKSCKVFRKCWTYLLSDIVLTTLFLHYGGLIWDQATIYILHSCESDCSLPHSSPIVKLNNWFKISLSVQQIGFWRFCQGRWRGELVG